MRFIVAISQWHLILLLFHNLLWVLFNLFLSINLLFDSWHFFNFYQRNTHQHFKELCLLHFNELSWFLYTEFVLLEGFQYFVLFCYFLSVFGFFIFIWEFSNQCFLFEIFNRKNNRYVTIAQAWSTNQYFVQKGGIWVLDYSFVFISMFESFEKQLFFVLIPDYPTYTLTKSTDRPLS